MRGIFNDYIGADVETTRARNAQRGACVYYRRGLCASGGVCVTRHHYVTPAGIVREELVSV